MNSGFTLAVLSNSDVDRGVKGLHLKFEEMLFAD